MSLSPAPTSPGWMPSGVETAVTGSTLRYEVLAEIAVGGMASVYLGRACGTAGFERLVALKRAHPHLKHDANARRLFLEEARLAARLRHPNVVSTLDVIDEDPLTLVMEYVEGGSLADLIKAAIVGSQPLPLGVVLRIVVDALAGLQASHELTDATGRRLGLVHRDISPQNILVSVDGVARVTDYGIGKTLGAESHTQEGHLRGKTGYLPPEVLRGERATLQADVYAAGVVLWEALASERLFRTETDGEAVTRILMGDIPRVGTKRAELPVALENAVARAVSADLGERFESAAAFAEALERAGVPLGSAREVSATVRSLLANTLDERRALLRDTGAPPLVEREEISRVTEPGLPAPARSRKGWLLATVAAVLGAAGAAAWHFGAEDAPPPLPPPVAQQAAPLPVPTPQPAVVAVPVAAPEVVESAAASVAKPAPVERRAKRPVKKKRRAPARAPTHAKTPYEPESI